MFDNIYRIINPDIRRSKKREKKKLLSFNDKQRGTESHNNRQHLYKLTRYVKQKKKLFHFFQYSKKKYLSHF